MIIKRNIGIIVLTMLSLIASGQVSYKQDAIYSKTQLIEDVTYLENFLVNGHPGLFWYSSEKEFKAAVKHIKDSIKSMTEMNFLSRVAILNNVIKCAHTDIRPSEKYNTYWQDSVKLIPINIMKVGNEYIVSQNLSESTSLNYGTRIVLINGMPIDEIIDTASNRIG